MVTDPVQIIEVIFIFSDDRIHVIRLHGGHRGLGPDRAPPLPQVHPRPRHPLLLVTQNRASTSRLPVTHRGQQSRIICLGKVYYILTETLFTSRI